jgi:hypothetical protein
MTSTRGRDKLGNLAEWTLEDLKAGMRLFDRHSRLPGSDREMYRDQYLAVKAEYQRRR